MANQSGDVYGLTILSPIRNDSDSADSGAEALRIYLAQLPRDENSPFAKVSSTHMCRLVVMDDVVFLGHPSHVEHLKSRYLVFESNFDGDLEPYLARMAREIPHQVEAVWGHCAGFPGVRDVEKFIRYMKDCQLTTTFYFADVNDKTVEQTLRALQIQSGLAAFIERNQGLPADDLKAAFAEFWRLAEAAPTPAPGVTGITAQPCFAADKIPERDTGHA